MFVLNFWGKRVVGLQAVSPERMQEKKAGSDKNCSILHLPPPRQAWATSAEGAWVVGGWVGVLVCGWWWFISYFLLPPTPLFLFPIPISISISYSYFYFYFPRRRHCLAEGAAATVASPNPPTISPVNAKYCNN